MAPCLALLEVKRYLFMLGLVTRLCHTTLEVVGFPFTMMYNSGSGKDAPLLQLSTWCSFKCCIQRQWKKHCSLARFEWIVDCMCRIHYLRFNAIACLFVGTWGCLLFLRLKVTLAQGCSLWVSTWGCLFLLLILLVVKISLGFPRL